MRIALHIGRRQYAAADLGLTWVTIHPEGGNMSDLAALKQRRERPPFQDWKGSVPDARIAAAVTSINQLIDQVALLGDTPDEDDVRTAVSQCVARFNELDDGWIMTIEREDIAEAILGIVEVAGFDADDDWIDDRKW